MEIAKNTDFPTFSFLRKQMDEESPQNAAERAKRVRGFVCCSDACLRADGLSGVGLILMRVSPDE